MIKRIMMVVLSICIIVMLTPAGQAMAETPSSAEPTAKPTAVKTTAKPKAKPTSKIKYTKYELILLARVVQMEAGKTHTANQLAVASVVINRLKSKKWPNSIKAVIYQRSQFTVVRYSKFSRLNPCSKALKNAKYVLENGPTVPNKVMFFKSAGLSKRWGSRDFYKRIGDNYFYS